MDRYYREEYAYTGEIESSGYPRDDALLAPDADDVRRRTRDRLGIAPGQTAVLYAPTWRDDQATNYRSAAMTRHLDLESATASLGDDFVFLMRGHRFHAQAGERSGPSARLLDVTDYPEINDLVLAADAAVLDYSSLRFDFALTGRPMLFLVPDLGSYTGGVRGFLYPFEESAPGPLLTDAEEVIAALRDLPRVSREYAAAYRLFNETYNYLQDGQAAERVVKRFFR
jgi:CDP-glycerol glycerophosphotransferase